MRFVIGMISVLAGVAACAGEIASPPLGLPPAIMKRISLSYDLNTLYPKDLDGVNFSGFGVGYAMDFPLSDRHPLYIGTGVDMRFVFRTKKYAQSEQYNLVNIKQSTTFINLNVPVNVSYMFHPVREVGVSPFAGFTFRVQLYGHNKNIISSSTDADVTLDDVLKDMDLGPAEGNLFSEKDYGVAHLRRFQMGWQVGVRVHYRRILFQAEYERDIVKLHKNLGGGNLLLSVGYTF